MMHRFLAPAREELEKAVDRYEARRPGLGAEFATAVQTAIEGSTGRRQVDQLRPNQ
jgi:hypothetical protein